MTTAEEVRKYLKGQESLSILAFDSLYDNASRGSREAVRAALYGHTLGKSVAKRNRPKDYYAIQMELPLGRKDEEDNALYFSLPGVPSELLEYDATQNYTREIRDELASRFSSEVVEYWMRAAQYRSVDLIQKNMKAVRERASGQCKLCSTVNTLRQDVGLQPIPGRNVIRACHVISRRTVFWKVVAEVSRSQDLFSANGVNALKNVLLENDYHSSQKYMIALCSKHDSLLRSTLKKHASH